VNGPARCPAYALAGIAEGRRRRPCPDAPVSRVWLRVGTTAALSWVALDVCPRHAAAIVADAEREAPVVVIEPPPETPPPPLSPPLPGLFDWASA
jgi:hypothetical protein